MAVGLQPPPERLRQRLSSKNIRSVKIIVSLARALSFQLYVGLAGQRTQFNHVCPEAKN